MQDKSRSLLSAKSGLRKQRRQNNFLLIFIAIVFVGIFVFFNKSSSPNNQVTKIPNIPQPTSTPTPTPTPTPKPLTFAEMNSLYGPCVRLPVLMYHHIQSRDAAKADKQTNLTVYTDVFQAQMQYLKSKNYNTVTVNDLINFFDAGIPIPAKSILLTFDDGYQDFYTDAYPVLSGVGYRATVFLPTGLMQNPGYLTWGEISGMDASVLFANHTWSHKSVVTQDSIMQREISTADTQLSERGLNNPKTFAYPYGPDSVSSEKFLASLGYKAAFTTAPGNILCKKQRFGLPRIRIGNSSLSGYGF